MTAPAFFRSAVEAANWIHGQGYVGKQGIVSMHQARREVGKLRKDPRHGFAFAVVKKMADKTWGSTKADDIVADTTDTIPAAGSLYDAKERYLLAQAQEKEWKLKELQGRLIDAAEEERRDVQILLGIRRHLETAIPDRAISLLARIKNLLPEEHHGIINAHLPEIIEHDRDQVADIFDQLATAGGV